MRSVLLLLACLIVYSARSQSVSFVEHKNEKKKIDVMMDGKLFTSFLYPDSLEKPVLYPLNASSGRMVSRGFPINPLPDELTDHPHHLGIWFNYENVNGLDFWNNSYAIPADRKHLYGWIKTTAVKSFRDRRFGVLNYRANWTNQKNEVLLEESTIYQFSGGPLMRVIERSTKLTANTEVAFNDAKDGMLGIRMAHELQIPTTKDQKFTDDKGNVTVVKAVTDKIAVGNYITSAGKVGDSAWSTRGVWCKAYGKMGN